MSSSFFLRRGQSVLIKATPLVALSSSCTFLSLLLLIHPTLFVSFRFGNFDESAGRENTRKNRILSSKLK
jgi:hypothetical protein